MTCPPEYADTLGARRRYRTDNDGTQLGDPTKAVAVLAAVDADEPPLHLPLGPRAYDLARTKVRVQAGPRRRGPPDRWKDR